MGMAITRGNSLTGWNCSGDINAAFGAMKNAAMSRAIGINNDARIRDTMRYAAQNDVQIGYYAQLEYPSISTPRFIALPPVTDHE